MSIATADSPLKVVLDTNILVSATIFGGNSKKILQKAIDGEIKAVTSKFLIAEFSDVLIKKFDSSKEQNDIIISLLSKHFLIVDPTMSVDILADKADNRVLEAAFEAKVKFIVTGDKELLDLKEFKDIKIVSPTDFLKSGY
ncbi:MAG TPA: putative toxin-antitoxin system toxin component, PIN family [Candidatus Nanoarchaeia archaeon]